MMARPNINSFVTAFKNFRVYRLHESDPVWKVENRIGKELVGTIRYRSPEDGYMFAAVVINTPMGINVYNFSENEMLDISNAMRNIRLKDGAAIHSHKKKK